MNDNTQALVPTPPDDLGTFVKSVAETLDSDAAASLTRVENATQELERFAGQEGYGEARDFLEAASDFFRAIVVVQTSADFAGATELLARAAEGFSKLGAEEPAGAAEGLRLYFSGVVEIQHLNLESGIDLLKKAQDLLSHAGTFGSLFQPLIDAIAPEQLAAAGVRAIMNQDFVLARVLLEDAARKSESFANKYAEEGTPPHSLYMGLAKFYRSYFEMFKSWAAFSRFDLDRLAQSANLGATAREARELLSKADLENPIQRNCYLAAGIIAACLDVLPSLAGLVRALLARLPVPDVDYPGLHKRLEEAETEAATLGEQGVAFVRVCQQIEATLENLRRIDIARPEAAAAARTAAAGKRRPIRLFVMMSFDEKCRAVEEALRTIFEDDPYYFQIILARDSTIHKDLLLNVKGHMDLVDGFIADISDLNPNVMLELGMAENDLRERPVFVLRREGSQEPPSDLKARLYTEYKLLKTDGEQRAIPPVDELRAKFQAIEQVEHLLRSRQARYLSLSYVTSQLTRARLAMDREEIQKLQKAFLTVEELLSSNAETIAQKTGFDLDLAEGIVRAFHVKGRKAKND